MSSVKTTTTTTMMSTNKIENTLSSSDCLSFYMPDLNEFKLETQHNLKKQQEKCNILKEILSSEKKYLSDLREIVEGYYEEIAKLYNDDEEFLYQIFSNIREIFEFTKSFYKLLEESTNNEVGIAKCFIRKHKTFIRLYSIYCQNYKTAYDTTNRLETDHNACKVIQKVKLKYGHCLKLATYLQLPVLRITKYHLLLQRYLKLLDAESYAYSQVFEALEVMKLVNNQINRNMPDEYGGVSTNGSSNHDNISMNSSDSGNSEAHLPTAANIQSLVATYGPVLKQGNLVLAQTKKVHYVMVFKTLLMIKKSGSPTQILHSISNESLAFLPKTSLKKSKYFTVIDYSQSKDDEMWQFTFKTKSIEDKKEWQSSIITCILNGYGKRLPDSVRSKVIDIKSDQFDDISSSSQHSIAKSGLATMRRSSNYILLKNKMPNFKKLTDFRNSLKNEFKSNDGDLKSKSTMLLSTNSSGNERPDLLMQQRLPQPSRRMSSPVEPSSSQLSDTQQQAPPSHRQIQLDLICSSFNNPSITTASTPSSPSLSIRSDSQHQSKGDQLLLIDKFFSKFRSSSSNGGTTKIKPIAPRAMNFVMASKTNSTSQLNEPSVSTSNTSQNVYKNKPIESIQKDLNAIFDQLNVSLEEITGNLEESNTAAVVRRNAPLESNNQESIKVAKSSQEETSTSKEFADILNKIDSFCGNSSNQINENTNNVSSNNNRSSKSSINSEEGYYSNHDSSISTQAETTSTNSSSIKSNNRTTIESNPESTNEDDSRAASQSGLLKFRPQVSDLSPGKRNILQGLKSSTMSKSMAKSSLNSSLFSLLEKSSSTAVKNNESTRSVIDNKNNLFNSSSNINSSIKSNNHAMFSTCSRLKNLQAKFHENFNSYSFNLSLNRKTPQSRSIENDKSSMFLADSSTMFANYDDDTEEENNNINSNNINVKDLISRFEKRRTLFNSSSMVNKL